MKTNRLAAEKSPYLLQHATNPVDWWPWGDEAFRAARKADKPVFLSIGYATCHWCHVMAHESFEDAGVARLLNDTFLCIKVDREERPDIDRIYMTACQRLTGSGGWPLTVFMTPDRQPFYAATYIPRESRYGRIGLMDLIPRIGLLWEQRRSEVLEAAEGITTSLIRPVPLRPERLSPEVLDHACRALQAGFDAQWGGFGEAPKFPMPHQLLFLIRYGGASGNRRVWDMVRATLDAMRRGGIWDSIGGGFHRYSTDRRWLVPHFEKMLYDQALLCLAYTEAFQATGERLYEETVREICTYVLRDVTDPGGAFHSAEDADSEGEEGKYYLWTEAELRRSLTGDEADLVISVHGVTSLGNYRDEATGTLTGANILHLPVPLSEAASRLGLTEAVLRERLVSVRGKLLHLREGRVRPSRDDKILTDWNGLMIAALARAAQILNEPVYLAAAERAATFLLRELLDENGRLLHRWREGEAAISGGVDDYAFLIWGFLELYEASFDPVWLDRALAVQEKLDAHFWDETEGGYFFTPDDGETVLARQKEAYDGAVPSGNAVAMLNLIRLGRISGNGLWEERARKLGEAFAAPIARIPTAHTLFLSALTWLFLDAREIVVAGDPGAGDTQALLAVLREAYLPNRVVLLLPEVCPTSSEDSLPRHAMDRLAPFTRAMAMVGGRATAYVCSGRSCHSPIQDPEALKRLLGTGGKP